jgi:phospholipid/cholesterol/gamma-HCH transport system substrate-binding protein
LLPTARRDKEETVEQSAQVKVGLFFILGVATLLVVYEFLGGFNFLTPGVTYTTTFHSANGLRIGDPVRLSGIDIGAVTDLRVADNAIEVSMRVNRDAVIKTDSVATIKFTSLLGANFIDVTFGSPSAKSLPAGGRIASREGSDLNSLVAEAQDLASSLNKNQQRFFDSLDQVVGNEKGGLKETMTNLNGLLADIRSGKGTLGKLATDDKLYVELQGSFEHFNAISEKVAKGEGTLGKLVTDDTLYTRLSTATDKLADIADRVSSGQGTLGKLVTDDSLFVQTKELTTNLNSILKKVGSGEGTLGKLVMDDTLYYSATDALRKLGKTADTAEDLAPLTTAVSIGYLLF